MRRWEFVGGGSAKFWEAEAEGAVVTVRYGRVGAEGRTQMKDLESAEAAQRYLAKVIAEKERKGYQEAAAPAVPAAAAERSPAEDQESGSGGGVVLPDEETFVMPAAWRRLVYPRRGGIARTVGGPRPEAEELVAGRLKEEADWVEQVLSAPKSEPRIVEAARAHLNGGHNPLGAAALAAVTMHYRLPDGVFVDAWVRSRGLAFAARAVVEYFDVEAHWMQYGGHREDPWIGFRPGAASDGGHWARPKFADRLRALLSVADEDAYRQAVDALARCRGGARRRVVVSYLVPGEQDWLAEACADAGVIDEALRAMLLCSLSSPGQLDCFGGNFALGWND